MATKVIHATAYKLDADSKGVRKDLALTRREVTDSKRVMREIQTPLEKYEQKSRKLAELVKKGAISQEQANRALAKYKTELKGATTNQSKFFAVLSRNKGLIAGVFSIASVRKFAGGVNNALDRMDLLQKQSKTLDIGAGSLLRLQTAGGLSAGLGATEVNKSLERMLKTIGDAERTPGVARTRIGQLNLDVQSLMQMRADKQFLAIADGISAIQNKNAQLQITQDIFGTRNAKMIEVLRLGSKGILEQTEFLGSRAKFLDENADKAERANDAFLRLGSSVQGLFERVAIGIAGDLETFAGRFEKLVQSGEFTKMASSFAQFASASIELSSQITPLLKDTAAALESLRFLTGQSSGEALAQKQSVFGMFTGGSLMRAMVTEMVDDGFIGGARRRGMANMVAAASGMELNGAKVGPSILDRKAFGEGAKTFAEIGKGIGGALFRQVKLERQRIAADKFGNFQFDSSTFDLQSNRIRDRISQLQGEMPQETFGKTIGSLAGSESIEAFKAQFGVGREQPVVDKLKDIESEIKNLQNELTRLDQKRAEAEQEKMKREFSNL